MQHVVHLVLIRHGNTAWNQTDRFTGWADIPIVEQGEQQAVEAGRRIAAAGITFSEVHTSLLLRTKQTAEILLAAANHPDISHHATWRLNERHYGQLQGMNKQEILTEWGKHNYHLWWRGYHQPPPALTLDDPRHPHFDPLYALIPTADLPRSESLQDCQRRLMPWWHDTATPSLKAGRNLLLVSHGNTIRSLVMHLDHIEAADIEHVEIPSGVPLVYRFDKAMVVTGKEWLA